MDIQLPQHDGMLPRRPTWVSPHGDHGENLWGSATGDQMEMEKGNGAYSTSTQILADCVLVCRGTCAQNPASDFAQL